MINIFKRTFILLFMAFYSLTAYGQTGLITIKLQAFDTPIQVDESFIPYVKIMNKLALMNDIKILVQQSFRKNNQEVENAIVVPVKNSNHLVGHAIDINFFYNDEYYTSKTLNKYDELPEQIKRFLIGCRIFRIRWGGDFIVQDSVHFDDNLYTKNQLLYEVLYWKYQERKEKDIFHWLYREKIVSSGWTLYRK